MSSVITVRRFGDAVFICVQFQQPEFNPILMITVARLSNVLLPLLPDTVISFEQPYWRPCVGGICICGVMDV